MASNYHRWMNKLKISGVTLPSPGDDAPVPTIRSRSKSKPALPNIQAKRPTLGAKRVKIYADSQGL